MLARLVRLVFACALLGGWQLALVHPLKHFNAEGGYVHLGDGHSHDRKSGSTDALCDAIAALVACATGSPAGLPPLGSRQGSVASPDSETRLAAAAPPFLSQGPPASS